MLHQKSAGVRLELQLWQGHLSSMWEVQKEEKAKVALPPRLSSTTQN